MSVAVQKSVAVSVRRRAIMLIAAALNFIVDPLQLFRPARLFAAMYSPTIACRMPG